MASLGVHPLEIMTGRALAAVATSANLSPTGLRVLIFGASRGIGAEVARRFAQNGASVALAARSHTVPVHEQLTGSLRDVARDVDDFGGSSITFECDIRQPKVVHSVVRKIVDSWGGLDVVVNNASGLDVSHAPTEKQSSLVMDVNARGMLTVGLACETALRESNGSMVTLSPPVDLTRRDWIAAHPHYTVSKYAATIAALGFAERGVASNTLWPRHLVATAATASMEAFVPGAYSKGRPASDFAEVVYALALSNRSGEMLFDDEVLSMPHTEAPVDLFVP